MNKPVNLFTFTVQVIIYTVQVITLFHHLFIYAYIFDDFPRNMIKNGGYFKTITMWNFIIQWTTIALTIFCDFLSYVKPNTERTRLVRIRDTLFNSLALPLGIFISAGFWAMYLRDEYAFWKNSHIILSYFPGWKNQALHTLPIVISLLDNSLIDHKRRDEKHGLRLLLLVMSCYTSFALFQGYYNGFWIYPYLRDMNHVMRVGFIVVHLALPALYYYVGGILYDLEWSKRECSNNCAIKMTIDSIGRKLTNATNIIK